MNEQEYYKNIRKIKRRNHIIFGTIVGGLAGLALGTKVYLSNPKVSYEISHEQKKNLYELALGISTIGIGGVGLFFSVKETAQLRMLEEEYLGDNSKR